jgi:tetratricopeptide (TPR) repeat protein
MSSNYTRLPLLSEFYHQYLVDQDSSAFTSKVLEKYNLGTLERLAANGDRMTRRAAVLTLGMVAGFSSNEALGRALHDDDRGARMLADNAIRSLWCRQGTSDERRHLALVIRLNSTKRYEEAVRQATILVERSPGFAEVWNQRAIALFALNEFHRSIRDCHRALELNPYHFGAASGMGQCYLQLGQRAEALDSFRQALELNPNLEGVRAQVQYLQRTQKPSELE